MICDDCGCECTCLYLQEDYRRICGECQDRIKAERKKGKDKTDDQNATR